MQFTPTAPAAPPRAVSPAPQDITPPSRPLARKALGLVVAQAVDGAFTVSSGTTPGQTYAVRLFDHDGSTCSCVGTRLCSHIWAARASVDPAIKRMLRQVAAPKARGRKGGAA